MNIPDSLLYTKDHEWIHIEDGTATVGITEFAQGELGDIVYVEIETLNQELEEYAIFGTVEAVKTVSDLFLPLAGTIVELNEKLQDQPELINQDPYGEGWMIKIRLSGDANSSDLLSAADYGKMIGQ